MIAPPPFAPARPPRAWRRARLYLIRPDQSTRKAHKARARMARLVARGGGADLQPRGER